MKNKVTWRSPSNIAIVKYWGKKGTQVGINPSISFTLSKSYTETEIRYQTKKEKDLSMQFFFNGEHKPDFENRIKKYFHSIQENLKLFEKYHLEIHSKNTFPHSAGIASSASAMSSLALGLLSIEQIENKTSEEEFFQKASFFARLGSGSASRSVYGGFVFWGKTDRISESSDDYAIPYPYPTHPIFKNLKDSILIIQSEKKEVSSSEGHQLMNKNPYREARIIQAISHCQELKEVLQNGDFNRFAEICESEALSLHGLMMNSNPTFILMEPETLSAINKIRDYRISTGSRLCFTLDAGPNIHLIYPEEESQKIKKFIQDELLVYCKEEKWIDDKIGVGPKRIE